MSKLRSAETVVEIIKARVDVVQEPEIVELHGDGTRDAIGGVARLSA